MALLFCYCQGKSPGTQSPNTDLTAGPPTPLDCAPGMALGISGDPGAAPETTFIPVLKRWTQYTHRGESGLGAELPLLELLSTKQSLGRRINNQTAPQHKPEQPSIAWNTTSRSGAPFLLSNWEATRSLLSSLDGLQRRLSGRKQRDLSRWGLCQHLGRASTTFVQPKLSLYKQKGQVTGLFLLTQLGCASAQRLLSLLHCNRVCSRISSLEDHKGNQASYIIGFPLPSLQ